MALKENSAVPYRIIVLKTAKAIALKLSRFNCWRKKIKIMAKEINTPDNPLEEDDQAKYFRWVRSNQIKYPFMKWIYASLSGIRLTPRMASKAKTQGNRKGICDICIPCARRGYHGAYIEMKRKRGGKLSPEQVEFLAHLEAEGYYKSVAKGADHAIEITKFYFGIK